MYCVASWWCCIQPQNCWWFSKSTMYLLCRLFYFYLKSFFSRYISFISRVWYPLFQGWIVLRSIEMVLYSAPELLMIQLANFAKSQISSLQLRKIWHDSLPTGSISNWKFYEQNQLLFCQDFQSKKPKEFKCTANFYPMKTTGTRNYGVPAGKTGTIYEKGLQESQRNPKYVVDKPCNIHRLQGNPMLIISRISCKDHVMPCKPFYCAFLTTILTKKLESERSRSIGNLQRCIEIRL